MQGNCYQVNVPFLLYYLESFVSFSPRKAFEEDSPDVCLKAMELYKKLKQERFYPWIFDPNHHHDGPVLFQMKCSVLRSCHFFIIFVTRGYAQSIWNLREFYIAILLAEKKLKIYVIELETGLEYEHAGKWLLNQLRRMMSCKFRCGEWQLLIEALKGDESVHDIRWSNIRFPYLKEVEPNEQKRTTLKAKLKRATMDIVNEFNTMLIALFYSLKVSAVDRGILASSINLSLQKEVLSLQAITYESIFEVIKANSSFFNYHLVKVIINSTGIPERIVDLQKYETSFAKYAARCLFKCPSSLGRVSSDTKLVIKTDMIYFKTNLMDIDFFKEEVCHILDIDDYSLPVHTIDEGCVKLVCVVPHHIQNIFPLSNEQERALSELGVLQLNCADYMFTQVLMYIVGNYLVCMNNDETCMLST